MAWIETAGGVALPTPAFGSGEITISTLVDGGRNANGDFVGQMVGNDKLKIPLAFNILSPEQFQQFLAVFDRRLGGSFINTVRVFDPRVNDYVYLDMYVGDRSGRPLMVNKNTMRPYAWVDVKASLIEV